MQEVVLTKEQLEERLTYWKEKLRLQDWVIKVEIVGQDRFPGDEQHGECQALIQNKQAYIKILSKEDYPNTAWFPHDMEAVLVHELLHLHFSPITMWDENNDKSVETEQAIESITSGLIALERKPDRPLFKN